MFAARGSQLGILGAVDLLDWLGTAAGDVADWLGEAIEHVPTLVQVVATAALYLIALIALTLLSVTMWKRVRRATLVVRAFADSGVGTKVGTGVGALVEERLIGALHRKEQIRDGYELDLVITDVDLLSEDNDLAKAVERLADVPQVQVVVGVLDLIERLLPSRGLAAGGELLPVGDQGAGISLALYQGNRLTARTALWEEEVKTWLPASGKRGASGGRLSFGKASPAPVDRTPSAYYDLAYPAAWWVQYEAGRVLDANVSQITTSGRSFALVGLGLQWERFDDWIEAEDSYSNALKHDYDNVAALFNLAQLLARSRQLYAPAALLLIHAGDVLYKRHQQVDARSSGPHRRDPNWYRARYALAVQFIELATLADEPSTSSKREPKFRIRRGAADRTLIRRKPTEAPLDELGWPTAIQDEEGKWRKEFGEVTADTLGELYRNRAPGREHLNRAVQSARQVAEDLVAEASETLEEAGWHWVARRPPRFVRWQRAISPMRITHRRPVLDSELIRFLSWVVEPASVVLLLSAWLEEEESVSRFGSHDFPFVGLREAIIGRREPGALDRRDRAWDGDQERIDPDWLIAYLARLVYEPARATRGARAQARLGRTQLRRSREPSFRVQYNLACFFSRLVPAVEARGDRTAEGEYLSIAAGQLERALFRLPDERRDRMAKWADKDPGLATLRERRAAEFAEIIARWGPSDRRDWRLDEPAFLQRISYDPGSALLDLHFLDGRKKRYGGVPQTVIDSLFGPPPEGHEGNEREARRKMEETFIELIERDYPPIRA